MAALRSGGLSTQLGPSAGVGVQQLAGCGAGALSQPSVCKGSGVWVLQDQAGLMTRSRGAVAVSMMWRPKLRASILLSAVICSVG